MSNENNNTNKDIANSLNKYSDYSNKSTNAILDSINTINKWYGEQVNKKIETEIDSNRLETSINNPIEEIKNTTNQLQTKVNNYKGLQTNSSSGIKTLASGKSVSENSEDDNKSNVINASKSSETSQRIATITKGIKFISDTTNKVIKVGKSINASLNEDNIRSFEKSSNRIMTKPVKKVTKKVTKKATNMIRKGTKKVVKKVSTKVAKKVTNALIKITKLLAKLIVEAVKLLIATLPETATIFIIIIILIALCGFFGITMSEDTKLRYENYMMNIQNEYDKVTTEFYNSGKVVEGTIAGKGMIDWKAPLAIIQVLNGDLSFDIAEQELLGTFKEAGLFEKITDIDYTYEKDIEVTDKKGNNTVKRQTVTETKKIVVNPSLDEYINWCNNNFNVINKYKSRKMLEYEFDVSQTEFSEGEIEQIRLLYNSNSFFDLFSDEFKNTYAYTNVTIKDEQIQAIYDEFLKNAGKRYLMDHSNLQYNECMEYYDCSSWVIHCLAHCKIKEIPNTTAQGIWDEYCYPIGRDERKPGDLIFLKNTYDTDDNISHIGIYMGTLTVNNKTTEFIIHTGGNPAGVSIEEYQNGWWDGVNFYGFARLKK